MLRTVRLLVVTSLLTFGLAGAAAVVQPGTPFFGPPMQQSFMENPGGTGPLDTGGDGVAVYNLPGPVVAGYVRLFETGTDIRTLSDIVFFVTDTDAQGNIFYRCADDNYATPTTNITGKNGCQPSTNGVRYFSDPFDVNDPRLQPAVGTPVDLDEPLLGQLDDAQDFVIYSPATDINGNPVDPAQKSTYKIFSDSEFQVPEPATPILVVAGFCLMRFIRARRRAV